MLEGAVVDRERGISLELVETALPGPARERIARLLEAGPSAAELVAALARGDDPWMARCAAWALEDATTEAGEMLTLMEKILFLRRVELFRDMPGRDLAVIADGAEECAFALREVVFREGEPGDALYLVTWGSVTVLKGNGAERKIVAILGANECFGEMAILTGERRSATVETAEEVHALRIRRAHFRDLVARYPHIAFPIFALLARRLKETTARYHEVMQG